MSKSTQIPLTLALTERAQTNLKVRWRAKFAMQYHSEESARLAILVWECRDRLPNNQLGKVLVCVHAVTIEMNQLRTSGLTDREAGSEV